MMLTYSFGMNEAAMAIEQAVSDVLQAGYRTADIWQRGCHKMAQRNGRPHRCRVIKKINPE